MTVSEVPSAWAPVALFIYRRGDHARRTIDALQQCVGFADSPIYVFADGPRDESDRAGVEEARRTTRALLGERAVYVERDTNIGVDDAIVEGVTELCVRYGRVVVVEDDLLVSPSFLDFVNAGLRRYAADPTVMQVAGHMFEVPSFAADTDALFLPMTTSWGWGTWQRAWDQFDPAATGWRERLRDPVERQRFDLGGRYSYSKMLSREMARAVPAWDIRWYYTVFARSGLVLYPPRSLVANAGFDGSGTHHRLGRARGVQPPSALGPIRLPATVAESPDAPLVFDAVRAHGSSSSRDRLVSLVKAVLRRMRPQAAR